MNKLPLFFLNRILKKTGPPVHLIWFITSRCNLRCAHCFYHRNVSSSSHEFDFREIKKTIEHLPKLLSVSLTGGEPCMREDLPDIVKMLVSKKITKNIILYSNGFDTVCVLNVTEKILRNCPNVNFFLSVSIDGFEEIHDKYRNKLGSYANAFATLKGLKKLKAGFSNLNIGVGITLHQGNQNIIAQLRKDIYAQIGVNPGITLIRGEPKSPELKNVDQEIYLRTINALENDRKLSRHVSFLDTVIATREVLGQKMAYDTYVKQSRSYDCYAGSLMAVIYDNGDVYPCEMLKDSCFGNLREYGYDIKQIWKSGNAVWVRKYIKTGKCWCTYECQYTCNTLYNPRFLPFFARDVVKYAANSLFFDRIKRLYYYRRKK